MSRSPDVSLVDVDETVLEQLLDLAKRDASPDEVAPPLGGPGWNLERTAWFISYHRAASEGLDGEASEKTWAIFTGGSPAGSIRLKRSTPGTAGKQRKPGFGSAGASAPEVSEAPPCALSWPRRARPDSPR
ncbi:hypothetical protein [Pseudarthrobacter siccitolerans]